MEVLPNIYLTLQVPLTWLLLDAADMVDFLDCLLDRSQNKLRTMPSAQQ
jgi:hypothetical protein